MSIKNSSVSYLDYRAFGNQDLVLITLRKWFYWNTLMLFFKQLRAHASFTKQQ